MIKFKDILHEALNSAVEFDITDDTSISKQQYYGAFKIGDTQYGVSLIRTHWDKVFRLDFYRIQGKVKKHWNFKTGGDVVIALSTVIKFVEAVIPYLGEKINGFIMELPKQKEASRFSLMISRIIQKSHIKRFKRVDIEKSTDKARNYILLIDKKYNTNKVFSGAHFANNFIFVDDYFYVEDEDLDDKLTSRSFEKQQVSVTPMTVTIGSEFEVDTVGDILNNIEETDIEIEYNHEKIVSLDNFSSPLKYFKEDNLSSPFSLNNAYIAFGYVIDHEYIFKKEAEINGMKNVSEWRKNKENFDGYKEVLEYTAMSYDYINNSLRNSAKTGIFTKDVVDSDAITMMKYFEEAAPALDEPIWVYRSVSVNIDKDINENIIDSAFLSTSISANSDNSTEASKTRLKILLPKGSRVIPILNFSKHDEEHEIILPAGSVLRVVEKAYHDDDEIITHYTCVFIGSVQSSILKEIESN